MPIQVRWYDNAAFRVDTEDGIMWFDPSINKNPDSPIKVDDVNEPAKFIFSTHGDSGHFTNSVQMALKTGAKFVGSSDLCDYILSEGQLTKDRVISLEFGNVQKIDGLEVYLFEAEHPVLESSPEKDKMRKKWGRLETRNGGFVVSGKNYSLCLIGDCIYSNIFNDVGRKFQIDIGMIPIQTKTRKDSPQDEAAENGALIVRDLKIKTLFPVIQYTKEYDRLDPLKKKLSSMGLNVRVISDRPGTVHTLGD